MPRRRYAWSEFEIWQSTQRWYRMSRRLISTRKRNCRMYAIVKLLVNVVTETFVQLSWQGTTKTGAEFNIGLMGLNFKYFLKLTHEPKYNTLTWTLDYKYNSDFGKSPSHYHCIALQVNSSIDNANYSTLTDDNVGHWQVMAHPSKR